MAKEKSGEPFEKLVAAIESALRIGNGEIVEHNKEIIEIDGVTRRIDVLIQGKKRILVECKDHKTKKVSLNEIGAFANLCSNSKSSGIFVSRLGFQSGAVKLANYSGIKILTLDNIDSEEIKRFIETPSFNTLAITTSILNFDLLIDPIYNDSLSRLKNINTLYEGVKEINLKSFVEKIHNERREDFVLEELKALMDNAEETGISSTVIDVIFDIKYNLNILQDELVIPVKSIITKVKIEVAIKEKEVEYMAYKEQDTIISTVMNSNYTEGNEEYVLSMVNTKESFESFLIPKSRSSNIVKLENLGELK